MIGIFLSYAGSGGEAKPMGFVFALISGMTYAFYILYLEAGGLQDIPAMKMIFYMNIVGSIMVFLIGKVSGSFVLHMNANAWIAAFVPLLLQHYSEWDFFSMAYSMWEPRMRQFKYI